jgi:hypothetical protein
MRTKLTIVLVLPNIDAYFASTGSASQAVRPTVCDQTGVAGGVQGMIDLCSFSMVPVTNF